jgi:hypothetical protein
VGAGTLAQPGVQLEKQFAAGAELSGLPHKFYCAGKYQRNALSALQFDLFLPEKVNKSAYYKIISKKGTPRKGW